MAVLGSTEGCWSCLRRTQILEPGASTGLVHVGQLPCIHDPLLRGASPQPRHNRGLDIQVAFWPKLIHAAHHREDTPSRK
ncbi:hypothetical protein WJX72_007455 [[Myrmecia] bisecta]|uniref:Uncharacterized protein n=1 Tax=[Myrmecia] bisecta TaxID=41462 RepID=A0AAW1QAQ5_9CHLO